MVRGGGSRRMEHIIIKFNIYIILFFINPIYPNLTSFSQWYGGGTEVVWRWLGGGTEVVGGGWEVFGGG